jgi:hypothetical protein
VPVAALAGGSVLGALYQESSGTITRLVFRHQFPGTNGGISAGIPD